jgi:hypothetical protein
MAANHLEEPDDSIWFGFGRIAEEYGERDAALAAYERIKAPTRAEREKDSTWALAQRRIHILRESAVSRAVASSTAPQQQ